MTGGGGSSISLRRERRKQKKEKKKKDERAEGLDNECSLIWALFWGERRGLKTT